MATTPDIATLKIMADDLAAQIDTFKRQLETCEKLKEQYEQDIINLNAAIEAKELELAELNNQISQLENQ